ncbi:uncharacterized protein LOC142150732 [Mixophyes fleayi]|uniref:uncharacterized protein LOC142150732 n=1 Tax=Mixophyes fleayi TaxID=3061075 RepID=UPI003F4E3A38
MEKCLFHQSQVSFVRYIVFGSGLQMDPDKMKAILYWPQPTGLKASQHFIGFINYYRQFIQGFSTLISPITSLTRKGGQVKSWSKEAVLAFKAIKEAFSTAPILIKPHLHKPFFLEVNASSVGVGAVLSQKNSPGAL